jgi:hypothetical protein
VLAVVVEERGGVVRSVVGESDSACTPGIVGVFLPAIVLPLVELLGDGVFRPYVVDITSGLGVVRTVVPLMSASTLAGVTTAGVFLTGGRVGVSPGDGLGVLRGGVFRYVVPPFCADTF